jgi:hypothetical protein
MACDGMEPEDLARELGMSGKALRDWLRERFPRQAAEHGARWLLSHQQVSMAAVGANLGRQRRKPVLIATARRPAWFALPSGATI